jgi:hypothetical protein
MKTSWTKWAAVSGLVVIAAAAWTPIDAQAPAAAKPAVAPDTAVILNAAHGAWGWHGGSSAQGYSPVQPIKFPHPTHVQKAGMNCLYCHFSANKSPDPGLPAVGTCMGCHAIVMTQSPEIKKLTKYWTDKQPIPWVRLHRVPRYVHFPHMRHVNAGVTCQTCHGQVQKMTQVFQYASLNMGWCVSCHVNGYDPQTGDVASGYSKTPTGWTLASVPASLPPLPGGGLFVADARAQGATASAPAAVKKARYDCASCHF